MEDYKSKSEKKREAEYLQVLGEKLVKLSADQLRGIDLPDEIYDAVKFARTIKQRIALRRQLQYIGTLMRSVDPAPIEEAIENIEMGNYKMAMEFKETERWRDELISGNSALIEEILQQCPGAERQKLSQLVRAARKEAELNKSPKVFRSLFRYLKQVRAE